MLCRRAGVLARTALPSLAASKTPLLRLPPCAGIYTNATSATSSKKEAEPASCKRQRQASNEQGDEDLLAALSAPNGKRADHAGEALAVLLVEHRQLKDQIASLASHCENLTGEVQTLAHMLKQRQVSNCRNLMERQAMEEGLEEVPSRVNFRPKIHMVSNQPTHVSQFDNTTLAQLALQGSHSAHKEQLIREIMFKDGVDWAAAHEKLKEMDEFNERFYWTQSMPYRVGITAAFLGAIAGTLMVFCRPVAELYGTRVAGEELPPGVEKIEDLTRNQVGTWTWSWMEPMIGTASFVMLCAQFGRAQAWKLNMRPYTEMMQRWRADRLAAAYPKYSRGVVRQWAKHLPMVDAKFFPTYRRNLGLKSL